MLIAQKYYKDFIQLLNKHQVQYILVGGVAVHSHGYERYTGDVDLWVNPVVENMEKLFVAIREFGFDTTIIEHHKFSEKDSPIKLVHEGHKIDIIHHLTNVVTFNDAWEKVIKAEKNDYHFYLIDYHHLIEIKLAAGRLKDLADVDELKKIRAVEKGIFNECKKPSFLKRLIKRIIGNK